MANLIDKLQNALDECRILILGGQVLVAFAAGAVLELGFQSLSGWGRASCLSGMFCLTLAVGIFMSPAAIHRLAYAGQDAPHLHTLTIRLAAAGLAPFAIGLACALYVAGERAVNPRFGAALASVIALLAGVAWYVVPLLHRHKARESPMPTSTRSTPLSSKVRRVLIEERMVLPGAQALLGFASVAVLTDRFKALPDHLKAVHLAALAFITIAVIFLMTPAAYHRIAERGELTQRFLRLASSLLLAAMAFLALGMAGAMWVVFEIGTGSMTMAALASAVTLVAFFVLWFAWPIALRRRRHPSDLADLGQSRRPAPPSADGDARDRPLIR